MKMNLFVTIKYLVFGYSFLVWIVSFSISDDLRNPKIFKRCFFASVVSFVLGLVFEIADFFQMKTGMTLLITTSPFIYLSCYYLLKKHFKAIKGTDPYITSTSSQVGGNLINGFWTKFPRSRKIMREDFIFSYAQALIPIFTFLGLMMLIIELNKN